MKTFRLLLVGVAAALLLGGCGGSGDESSQAGGPTAQPRPEKPRGHLTIGLNGIAGPETAGIVLADRRGYFDDVGLDTYVTDPASPSLPITYVANGSVDVAVAQEPELVLARDEGFPLVAFGSLLPHPTMAMIWLEGSGIEDVADLGGKRIAFPGSTAQKDFLEAVLASAGLELADVELDAVGYDMTSALERGRADAIFGGSATVEGASLEGQGLRPRVTPVTEIGVPGYDELVLVTRPGLLASDPTLAGRVLKAVSRGNAAVRQNPEAGREAIAKSGLERTTLKDLGAGVEATAPLLSETGEIDPGQVSGLVGWMYDQGMIEQEVPASELLADEAPEPGAGGE